MPDITAEHPHPHPTRAGTGSIIAVRNLTMLGMALTLGMLVLGALVLVQTRNDAWRQADQASANLALALERGIARNISAFDSSLQGAVATLQQPGIDQVSPPIRQAAVFAQTAGTQYLGSILLLDAKGNVIEDSTSLVPHRLNLGDRDYFQVHRTEADTGLYISHPFHSRLRGGGPTVAFSRRVTNPDGSFRGVIIGAMRLAFFKDLFARLDLGAEGSVGLFRADGWLIARYPERNGDFNRNLSGTAVFRGYLSAPPGQVVDAVSTDGIERRYIFRQIGTLPLILSVGVSTREVFAAWWRRALVIGPILAALCIATVALCLLFRREMLRRLGAESALLAAAARLTVLASTDPLTGLLNRRAFETELSEEWRRSISSQSVVAMMMLDVDSFKPYNDHYGHQQGDSALRSVAECLSQQIRCPRDLGARYGGEEFIVLLPQTDLGGAALIAERVRSAVAALAIPHQASTHGHLTVSIGVAAVVPKPGERETMLIAAADEALYEAKNAGRNGVARAGEGTARRQTHSLPPPPLFATPLRQEAFGTGA